MPEPWKDYIPTYKQDNAKGYNRYTDKLAKALNGVITGEGGVVYAETATLMSDTVLNLSYNSIKSLVESKAVILLKKDIAEGVDTEGYEIGWLVAYGKTTVEGEAPVYWAVFVTLNETLNFANTDPELLLKLVIE